ncbi:pilin [Micromonospora aurantiaca (nom. illeg.)]|uniref:pilin n=1 Tax=Micromonospora aurantiaca (nom. illeg.) TaxID=47850 RepID=UPI0033E6348E
MTTKSNRMRPLPRKPSRRERRPRMHPSNWVLYQATRAIPVLIVLAGVLASATVLGDTAVAAADAGAPMPLAADSIQAVVNNIRVWLVGILVAVATLFLTVGGLRYLAANGDPGETEKGKLAMKSAAVGYALALLAPLFVTIVGQWVA